MSTAGLLPKLAIGLALLAVALSAAAQKATSLDDQLRQAAFYSRVDELRELLAKGAHVDAKDNNGDTPLIKAAEGRSTEAVMLLLDKGADIEAKGFHGNTPLMAAAIHVLAGNTEIIKLLLEKG